uniref:molybdopterin molybdotransferase n=1 Tax=Steinernema glaseri TaxID=37863 RepID=A0A1I8ABA5_9BILA
MRIAIITISDSSFVDKSLDRSGPVLRDLIQKSEKLGAVTVTDPLVIPDERELITTSLLSLCDCNEVVLTTGGTGFAPRDVTPEATNSVIERACPGIVTALLNRSLQATPFAALTRLSAGIRGSTLIVNLPGNPKAVKECFEVLETFLLHAVQLIKDDREDVVKTHKQLS